MNTLLSVFHLMLGIVISGVAHIPDSGDSQAIILLAQAKETRKSSQTMGKSQILPLHIPSQMKSLNECPWNPHTLTSVLPYLRECPFAHLSLTLCYSMVYSQPCSSVHGLFQARILEWVAISFSRESSQPRHQTWVSCIAGRFFTCWAIEEVPFPWMNLYQKPALPVKLP